MEQEKTGESSFLKAKCTDCGNEQVIFSKAATLISCQVCGATMAVPTGGKASVKAEVVGEFK